MALYLTATPNAPAGLTACLDVMCDCDDEIQAAVDVSVFVNDAGRATWLFCPKCSTSDYLETITQR